MSLLTTLLAAGSLASLVCAQSIQSLNARDEGNDVYRLYSGRATASVWPTVDEWVSDFDTMFAANMPNLLVGCTQFGVAKNSETEITTLRNAVKQVSSENGVDPRFIFAIVMQESQGCVRAPTTTYGHSNPGLMQSHRGTGTCNANGFIQNPCPANVILTMIRDGASGTQYGDGLQQLLPKAPSNDDMKYYQAARMYNSGSIDSSGYLERGIATHCYASDVANRLTGWHSAPSTCRYDTDGLPPLASEAAPVLGATKGVVASSRVVLSARPGATGGLGGLSARASASPTASSTFSTAVSSAKGLVLGAGSQSRTILGSALAPRSQLLPSAASSASIPQASRAVASRPGPGVTTDCAKYYRAAPGDSCGKIFETANITLLQFRTLNKAINPECTNIWAGYDYCVQGL